MKSEEIKNLFAQFEAAAAEIEGIECWSARELQSLLGYNKWENFEKVIDKAKAACTNAGEDVSNHCCPVKSRTKSTGSGGWRVLLLIDPSERPAGWAFSRRA